MFSIKIFKYFYFYKDLFTPITVENGIFNLPILDDCSDDYFGWLLRITIPDDYFRWLFWISDSVTFSDDRFGYCSRWRFRMTSLGHEDDWFAH